MKKLWILGLATLLVIPFISACSVSNEYKVLREKIVDFTTDSTYAEFFNGNIQFYDNGVPSGLQTEKSNPSSHYYTITYYEQVIKMSLTNIKNFYGPLESVPTFNTNSTKKLCSTVINNINSFKSQVEKFNERKQNMIFQYKLPSSSAGEQTYNDFQTDLGHLAKSANNLQLSFMNVLTTLYYPFEQNTDETISESKVECGVAKTYSTLVDDYIKFAILENNYEHPKTTCQLYTSLANLSQKLETPNVKTQNFGTWLEQYKLFKSEHNMFLTSINSVDMTKDYNNLSTTQKTHYDRVMRYVNENAPSFVNQTISLLY